MKKILTLALSLVMCLSGVRSFFCKLAFYGKIVFFRQGFQPMP